jgi:hypothetical protein
MSLRRSIFSLGLFVVSAVLVLAVDLKVGTLNTYLFFDPSINHTGKVDDENRMTAEEYRTKVENLSTLIQGYEIIALQETGGRDEIIALAAKAKMDWLWSRGKDTATGEEVGVIYHLPGWKVTSRGRVGDLDKVVSKHLLVSASKGTSTVYFLAVHLLRPIGAQTEKHQGQLDAIGAWARELSGREPKATVVVLGDTNNTNVKTALYGLGTEAGALNQFAATHLSNKCFDRLVAVGPGHWTAIDVRRPPYPHKPNDTLKRIWTDHFFVGATLALP